MRNSRFHWRSKRVFALCASAFGACHNSSLRDKKAREYGRQGFILPAIPLVFAVLAFISVGVHAVKLAPLGWVIYIAIFAFFYFAAIALEIFAPRWKWKPQICELVFILLAFLIAFVAAPFITGTLNTVSADPFGFGFLLMLFTVYPVLFVSAGIYLCKKIIS